MKDEALSAISHVIHSLEEMADRPADGDWALVVRVVELTTLADQLVSAHRLLLKHQTERAA